MAGHAERPGGRLDLGAYVSAAGAAGPETAAAGRVLGAGHVAFEDDVFAGPLGSRVGDGHGREKGLGIGMVGKAGGLKEGGVLAAEGG